MQKIIVKKEVLLFLDELITTLVESEYFGFAESAKDYVNKLYDAIYNDLPGLMHHVTPDKLKQYGSYYAKIKSNKRTTWYVFFDKRSNRYFVEFIANNHTPHSAFLNRL